MVLHVDTRQPNALESRSFGRIAVLNRGEPAIRFLRALREYNFERGSQLEAIAFCTDPDEGASFVRLADEVVHLGNPWRLDAEQRQVSAYCDHAFVLDKLHAAGCDALWPGWGFLSEDHTFVAQLEDAGIVFLGPSSRAMQLLGDKVASKRLARRLNVPLGAWCPLEATLTPDEIVARVATVGYPLMIKASSGGGGRGIRKVLHAGALLQAVSEVREEVKRYFGHGEVFAESCLEEARHIEVQIVVGVEGKAHALGTRDCTFQRRHQKVLEETPAPNLPPQVEQELVQASIRLMEHARYQGVGTVEFLYAPGKAKACFLEVNSRLQVEHTITEVGTGCDLVKAQLDIARGLPWEHPGGPVQGHVIEARLNAENPERDFQPSPGKLRVFRAPSGPGIRVDSGVNEGMTIAPEFDSMLAKVIAAGTTRRQAIARLRRALQEFQVVIEDGATNKAFLLHLLEHPTFLAAEADTAWLDRTVESGALQVRSWEDEALLLAAIVEYRLRLYAEVQSFFAQAQNGIPQGVSAPEGMQVQLRLRDREVSLHVMDLGQERYLVGHAGTTRHVKMELLDAHTAVLDLNGRRHQALFSYGRTGIPVEIDGTMHLVERASGGLVAAPAPALVVHVAVTEGDIVQVGDRLCTLEVMKMEMEVRAQEDGVVRSILCRPNQQVNAGQSLVILEREGHHSQQDLQVPSPQTLMATPWQALFVQGEPLPSRLDECSESQAHAIIDALFTQLRSILLGFDVAPDLGKSLEALFREESSFKALKHPQRWLPLVRLLWIFSDGESLFDRNLLPLEGEAAAVSAELDFYDFCRRHHEGEDGAHTHFRAPLRRALAHYGVHQLDPCEDLREALWRLAVGHTHGGLRHRLCSSLLRMVMGLHAAGVSFDEIVPPHAPPLYDVLEQVALVARREYPFVADNAQQASYILFDQGRYVQRSQLIEGFLRQTLEQLHDHLIRGQQVHEIVEAIVHSRHSLLSALMRSLQWDDPGAFHVAHAVLRRLYARPLAPQGLPQRLQDCLLFRSHLEQEGELCEVLTVICSPSARQSTCEALKLWLLEHQNRPACIVEWLVLGQVTAPNFAQLIEDNFTQLQGDTLRALRHLTLTWCNGRERVRHRTYKADKASLVEQPLLRDIHPAVAQRIELSRLREFDLRRLTTPEQIYAFHAQAKQNPKDVRIFVFAEVWNAPKPPGIEQNDESLWEFEQLYFEGLRVIREQQSRQEARKRFHWNRFTFYVHPTLHLTSQELTRLTRRFEPHTRGLGLQKVVIRAHVRDAGPPPARRAVEFILSKRGRHRLEVHTRQPSHHPVRAMTPYDLKVVRARRLGCIYPYEIAYLLEGRTIDGLTPHPDMARGRFQEVDLDSSGERLIPVERPRGQNAAGVVVGLVTNETAKFPDGMERVWIASDPTRAMGALAEPECRRILAALDLAEAKQLPIEWLPISAGARIAMDSGTENLDWTARVLKRIVAFTQKGGEINVIVAGVNVGAQSYWNAEATMLMHTRGVLIMTPNASMVLTGKKALEYSGGVAAENERCIGGFDRIMGPNGQAQYFAQDLGEAYAILFDHYRFTYRRSEEQSPRPHPTRDPITRSILEAPYRNPTERFSTIGEIFDQRTNPGRKKPFAIREVMAAVIDQDDTPLERFQAMRHADTAVVWDCHIGGNSACLVGFESRPSPRRGRIPIDGPDTWTGGTLFPQSSKKVARALNAASGNRPVVILANLSGFDGSPESLRKLQLEMGAEIGRAVVNFEGRILFVVIGRYHGGAYVVFSKALNPNLTAIALEGTYASVIGGAPAAAVVFPHEVRRRTEAEPTIQSLRAQLDAAPSDKKPRLREELDEHIAQTTLEKQGEVAREFDAIHTVERAVAQGSLDAIIPPHQLRPTICNLLKPT